MTRTTERRADRPGRRMHSTGGVLAVDERGVIFTIRRIVPFASGVRYKGEAGGGLRSFATKRLSLRTDSSGPNQSEAEMAEGRKPAEGGPQEQAEASSNVANARAVDRQASAPFGRLYKAARLPPRKSDRRQSGRRLPLLLVEEGEKGGDVGLGELRRVWHFARVSEIKPKNLRALRDEIDFPAFFKAAEAAQHGVGYWSGEELLEDAAHQGGDLRDGLGLSGVQRDGDGRRLRIRAGDTELHRLQVLLRLAGGGDGILAGTGLGARGDDDRQRRNDLGEGRSEGGEEKERGSE